ncbi:MAG: VTC domain-containing protein [Planctomycetota bacterium]
MSANAPFATDNTLRSRFECKYLIPKGMAEEIRQFTRPYLELDFFSARAKKNRYPVHSLYLDGPANELYETTIQGMKNRFKLRIRGYDGRPDSPLFAEVKRRADRVILKRRTLISRPAARALLANQPMPEGEAPQGAEFAEFRSLYARVGARPAVYVSYLREAYEAMGSEPARLTFDTHLHNATPDPSKPFAFEDKDWEKTPVDNVILEVKFTDACPHWIEAMVEHFQLARCSVAKYILCLDANQDRYRHAPQLRSHG